MRGFLVQRFCVGRFQRCVEREVEKPFLGPDQPSLQGLGIVQCRFALDVDLAAAFGGEPKRAREFGDFPFEKRQRQLGRDW